VSALPEHPPSWPELYVAIKAFLYSFFVQLGVEKGYKRFRHKRKR